MAGKLIHDAGGVTYWANLDWQLLPPGDAAVGLRGLAGERGVSHAAVVQSLSVETVRKGKKQREIHRHKAGLYIAPEGQGSPKKAHSLAAAFAKWARSHGNAVLHVSVPGDRWYVAVIQNGMPVLDKVEDRADAAFALATQYMQLDSEISVFADDPERFPRTLMAEGLLEAIYAAADKSTLIAPVPPDMVKLAIAALVILSSAAGFFMWKQHQAELERQRLIREAAERDPANLYLTALAGASARAGLEPASVMRSIESADKLPTTLDGWNLVRAGCDMAAACEVHYARSTGTFAGLKAALATLPNLPKSLQLTPTGTELDSAVLTWDPEWQLAVISPDSQFPTLREFVQGAGGSQLQDWRVAGLGTLVQEPALWPQVTGVPASFRHPRAIASGKFEVTGVPLPLVTEVVTKVPHGVIWTGWRLAVTEGRGQQDVMQRAVLKVEGNFYVQHNEPNPS
jgi:hypothetical protein